MSRNEFKYVPNNDWQLPREKGKPKIIGATGNETDLYWDSAHMCWRKGIVFGKSGRFEDALKAFDGAINLDPDHVAAWVGKGSANLSMGRCKEALNSFDKAINLDPHIAMAWRGKGIALLRLDMNSEALEAFSKTINLDPDDAVAWQGNKPQPA